MATIRVLAVLLAMGGIAALATPCNWGGIRGFAFSCASPIEEADAALGSPSSIPRDAALFAEADSATGYRDVTHRRRNDPTSAQRGGTGESMEYYTSAEVSLESIYAIASSTAEDACCSGGANGGTDATGNECTDLNALTVIAANN